MLQFDTAWGEASATPETIEGLSKKHTEPVTNNAGGNAYDIINYSVPVASTAVITGTQMGGSIACTYIARLTRRYGFIFGQNNQKVYQTASWDPAFPSAQSLVYSGIGSVTNSTMTPGAGYGSGTVVGSIQAVFMINGSASSYGFTSNASYTAVAAPIAPPPAINVSYSMTAYGGPWIKDI